MKEMWWDNEVYRSVSNAEISDALDSLGLPGSALGITCVTGGQRILGCAFTVRFGPIDHGQPGTVGDFIDDVLPGQVIVLDNGGRTDCTVWGGILSQIAKNKQISGTVINGVCRDLAEAIECAYPIFSRGAFMRTGKDRVQVEAIGRSVSLGDVRVAAGDLISGDRDGVVVVPAACAREVMDQAVKIHSAEKAIVDRVKSGLTLTEARKQLGYHELQRNKST